MLLLQTRKHYMFGTEQNGIEVSTGNNETPRLTTTPASTLALEADDVVQVN